MLVSNAEPSTVRQTAGSNLTVVASSRLSQPRLERLVSLQHLPHIQRSLKPRFHNKASNQQEAPKG
jgi:hypothetical protein